MTLTTEADFEFVGLAAYASLGSFGLLAQDAAAAPSVREQLELSRMAANELAEVAPLEELVEASGRDADALLDSYRDLLSDFVLRAVPRDWWERIIRTYVGFNLLQDLLENLAASTCPQVRQLTQGQFGAAGHDSWVVERLTPVLADDPQLAARLGLWGRRVVGEALTLVQRLFVEHPDLRGLLAAGPDPLGELMNALQTAHARRLQALGLNA